MFLGTNEIRTVFWTEPTVEDIILNVESIPTNKFYLITLRRLRPFLEPVTFSEDKQERIHKVRVASAGGKELN